MSATVRLYAFLLTFSLHLFEKNAIAERFGLQVVEGKIQAYIVSIEN